MFVACVLASVYACEPGPHSALPLPRSACRVPEDMSKLLMTVIRFCITVEDHELKKLLVYFWECVKKYDASGHLKPEMILVWYVSGAPV
jgi:hypothetical protein